MAAGAVKPALAEELGRPSVHVCDRKDRHVKKVPLCCLAYVGVIVGAGLASGQDLLQYFLSFGAVGLIGIAALGVLNVIFGVVALQLGSYYRSGHHDEVFERITHPAVRRVIDVVLVFLRLRDGLRDARGCGREP